MKVKWFIFLLLLRKKRFRHSLEDTLTYALSHYKENRGKGASDVLFFDQDYTELIQKVKQ